MHSGLADNRGIARHRIAAAAAVPIILTGMFYLWTSLVAIINFRFQYPAFDQYRIYPTYFNLAFPENVLQLENGHRTILPSLVRLAEMIWFHADQQLQIVVGTCCALSALGMIVFVMLCQKGVPKVRRLMGVSLAVMGLFWLGNARMLMHGAESLHVYMVIFATVLALLVVHSARSSRSREPIAMAGLCCVAATFSFGTGIASFAALIVVSIVVRLSRGSVLILVAMLAVTLLVYVKLLPGSAGVGNSMHVDPLGNVSVLLRWFSAPWMTAWLGLADPPLIPWLQQSADGYMLGSGVVQSARLIADPFGESWMMREAWIVGMLGALGYIIVLIHAWLQGQRLSRARLLALGLATFGAGAAAIICLARLQLFRSAPDQVFADRYLPWSCLFWLGLGLYVCASEVRSTSLRVALSAALVLAVGLVIYPSQRGLAAWSAVVSRHLQQSAVAAQLGLWDPERFPDETDASQEQVRATLDRMRAQRLSMFAEPAYLLLGRGWRSPASGMQPLAGASARVDREFEDAWGHRRVAAIEGSVPRVENLTANSVIVIVDQTGTLRGLAKFSFSRKGTSSLYSRVQNKRGFDGYVLVPQPGEVLRVLVLDASQRVMAEIPLTIPSG